MFSIFGLILAIILAGVWSTGPWTLGLLVIVLVPLLVEIGSGLDICAHDIGEEIKEHNRKIRKKAERQPQTFQCINGMEITAVCENWDFERGHRYEIYTKGLYRKYFFSVDAISAARAYANALGTKIVNDDDKYYDFEENLKFTGRKNSFRANQNNRTHTNTYSWQSSRQNGTNYQQNWNWQKSYTRHQSGNQSQSNSRWQNPPPNQSTATADALANAYKTLNISPSATNEEVRKAYHAECRKYHPDKNQNLSEDFKNLANAKMQEVNAAYHTIKKVRGIA